MANTPSAKVAEIKKLFGQSFFIAIDGLELAKDASDFITEANIGGVTLFSKNNNYENPAQVAELINAIQVATAKSGKDALPSAICVDHEGGRVQRFRKPFTKFPPMQKIGELDSSKTAFEIAKIQAQELKAVGVNVNFAPVADINTNPNNPVIGDRAFGDHEEVVSKMVSAFVRGYLAGGIQPVVKHFPGHGDTHLDSHFALPILQTKPETLRDREFRPFSKAFKSGCEMVMTAHIILEKIDPKLPATLSHKVINDILRNDLRFRGLICSDDMEMKAITDSFGKAESAIMALEAGVDILLYNSWAFIQEAYDPILTLLTSPKGIKAVDQLTISYTHIQEFKKKNFLPYEPVVVHDLENKINNKEIQEFYKTLDKSIKK